MYKAEILADSLSPQGHRLATMKITFPRFILAELNTHRMFSRNSGSSRAIPFKKMVQMVKENPFIPIAWQKDHKGMQGTEYFNDKESVILKTKWLKARDRAIESALDLAAGVFDLNEIFEFNEDGKLVVLQNVVGVTKQLCNRLLEPFMWHTVIVTATEWKNFFELRCPQYYVENVPTINENLSLSSKKIALRGKSKKELLRTINEIDNNSYTSLKTTINGYNDLDWLKINHSQADIHIQAIAELMFDAYNESTPKQLQSGEWHIPFGNNIDSKYMINNLIIPNDLYENKIAQIKLKIATARCARISYETLGDNPKIDYEADIKLYDRLLKDKHMSPFEHCARAMSDEEYVSYVKGNIQVKNIHDINCPVYGWCDNFKGFISHRHIIESKTT